MIADNVGTSAENESTCLWGVLRNFSLRYNGLSFFSVIIVTDLSVHWNFTKNISVWNDRFRSRPFCFSTLGLALYVCALRAHASNIGSCLREIKYLHVCVPHTRTLALLRMWTQICKPVNVLDQIDRSTRYLHCCATVCRLRARVSYCLEALRPLTYFTTYLQSRIDYKLANNQILSSDGDFITIYYTCRN